MRRVRRPSRSYAAHSAVLKPADGFLAHPCLTACPSFSFARSGGSFGDAQCDSLPEPCVGQLRH